jgi:hypothetical protein
MQRLPLLTGDGDHPRSRERRRSPNVAHRFAYMIARDGALAARSRLLTGYKGSSRDTYVQRLRSRGLMSIDGVRLLATEAGKVELGSEYEPLPTGSALLQHWFQKLPEGERALLETSQMHTQSLLLGTCSPSEQRTNVRRETHTCSGSPPAS